MSKDCVYTGGVIAVKENSLLGSKLFKLAELSADEAFRSLSESGFSRGTEGGSVYDYESVLAADMRDLDAFIREYAPTNAERDYFLAPRDFHNAKAILKSEYSGAEKQGMLAPDGNIPSDEISRLIKERNFAPLGKYLAQACKTCVELFEGESEVSGAEIGLIFEKALFAHLTDSCKRNSSLKKLIKLKADYTDILAVMRSKTPEYALNNCVLSGELKVNQLEKLTSEDMEKAASQFLGTKFESFVNACFEAKQNALPFTKAERMLADIEIDYLQKKKYELKNSQPFLYYVLRRRAENINLRIIFVCLMAGMGEEQIKSRLRAV